MEGTLQNENKLVGTLSNGASMVGGVGTVFAKDGEDGKDGKDGASAYEIAQKNGFEGTETEWLLTLKGERGEQGEKGEAGANGKDGVDGKNGTDGKDGVDGKDGSNGQDGISATHKWNGTVLTVTSASGTSSADLKGEKGEKGDPGEKGADGTMTFEDLTPEQRESLKGDKGADGKDGVDGTDGVDGKDGTSATHSWNGTVLTVTSASGTSSADLKGEKGDKGNPGEKGDPGEKGETGENGADGEKGERGDPGVYVGSGDMPEDCYVQIDPSGESNEEIIDRYIANAVTQAIREALAQSNKITYVTLNAANWVGADSPYSQIVTIPEATAYSKIDLNPSVEQLTIFHDKDLTFVVENNGGVITVYCVGQKPTNDYTIQAKITEVTVI